MKERIEESKKVDENISIHSQPVLFIYWTTDNYNITFSQSIYDHGRVGLDGAQGTL